jgi:hypothetical protein
VILEGKPLFLKNQLMQKWVGTITLTSAHKPPAPLSTGATLLISLDFR